MLDCDSVVQEWLVWVRRCRGQVRLEIWFQVGGLCHGLVFCVYVWQSKYCCVQKMHYFWMPYCLVLWIFGFGFSKFWRVYVCRHYPRRPEGEGGITSSIGFDPLNIRRGYTDRLFQYPCVRFSRWGLASKWTLSLPY